MQYYFSFFITLAGLPTATESSGISFTTTLPAPMMLRSPMVTPGHTSRLLVAEVVELAASHFLKSVHIRLFVFVQPLNTALVGQVLHLEVLELRLESLAVGACCSQPHLHRCVVLHPAVAHHGIGLVVERIEYLNSIQTADDLNPYEVNRLVE